MATINIENNIDFSATPITNEFIDKYMPKANGNFVKVYIFLYRYCYHHKKLLVQRKFLKN